MLKMVLIVAGLLAALIPFLFLLRRVVDLIGFPCKFCHARVRAFADVPMVDQENILEYFRRRERRDPDPRGVFVCLECRTVHDDFSGAKESRDIDLGGATAFCKVCGSKMRDCELENEHIACAKCGTPYRWEEDRKSGFRFLSPPDGTRLLERLGAKTLDAVIPFPGPRVPQPRDKEAD